MSLQDEEALRQALVELEQLNTVAEKANATSEMLLKGLHKLAEAQSGQDSLITVLSVLSSAVDEADISLLVESEDDLESLAATKPELVVEGGVATGPLLRAFAGKPVILTNAQRIKWWDGLPEAFGSYGSALLQPVSLDDRHAVLVCLLRKRASFNKAHTQRLQYFLPLAVQGVRQSKKMARMEAARRAAENAAKTDALTHLGNRFALDDFMMGLLRHRKDFGRVAFALVDLNAFKPINDNYGHEAGDSVLRIVANRLRELGRDELLVVRLGGDEFGVVHTDIEHNDDLTEFGSALVKVFSEPIKYDDNEFRVGASIGIAHAKDCHHSLDKIISAADRAMYSMKAKKVTGYAVYVPTEQTGFRDAQCPKNLRRGIDRSEFTSYFQPKIDLTCQRVVGFEVLARWQHPTAGIVAPGKFLRSIESAGLSNDFTHHMVTDAIRHYSTWRDMGLSPPPIAINLSEVYLAADNGAAELIAILEAGNIRPEEITFEITEDILIARSSDVIARSVQCLKDWGGDISLDDFGTGYGSLRHLLELPLDELKIDMGFVSGIGKDRGSEVIIEGILHMAKKLNLAVVAEGVETLTQATYLMNAGCLTAQGFLYSPAVSAEQISDMLLRDQQNQSAAGLGIQQEAM